MNKGKIVMEKNAKKEENAKPSTPAEYEHRISTLTLQLSNATKELEDFTYAVSHDLRAPLRAIDGFSQALLEDCQDKLNEQGKDYITRICNAVHRVNNLIDGILNLSRIIRSEVAIEVLDLTLITKEIITQLQNKTPERCCSINIAPNLQAKGDKKLITLALTHLIDNAWKFSTNNPKALIEIGEKTGCFFIKDNGMGFDMQYVHQVFAPFQRLHNNEAFKGTGMGLPIVQRIINRHGGKIWVESEINKGTTFYFTL